MHTPAKQLQRKDEWKVNFHKSPPIFGLIFFELELDADVTMKQYYFSGKKTNLLKKLASLWPFFYQMINYFFLAPAEYVLAQKGRITFANLKQSSESDEAQKLLQKTLQIE